MYPIINISTDGISYIYTALEHDEILSQQDLDQRGNSFCLRTIAYMQPYFLSVYSKYFIGKLVSEKRQIITTATVQVQAACNTGTTK